MPHPNRIRAFQRRLLPWYLHNGRDFPWRRKSASCYEKVIAEILLQRTQAERVAAFFAAFVREFPSWRPLSSVSEEEIGNFLRPLGLWQRRARSLKELADAITRRGGRLPKQRREIESLPGVGQYIANAIELLCYERPRPLLDVNMARVLERFFGPRRLADIRFDPYLQGLAGAVVHCEDPKGVNWAILDLATLVCRVKEPLHPPCPLRARCGFAQRLASESPDRHRA